MAVAPSDLAWVRRFRGQIARNLDPLCDAVSEELGKPGFETLSAELIPLMAACRWTEKRARRVLRDRRVAGAGPLAGIFQIGQRHRVVRVLLGDVAIIATWNYPYQLLGVQLVHAMVGGNRVWAKPSERSPVSQGMLLDLAERAMDEVGIERDRLTRVDATREAGEQLLAERRFDHVVFTGSTEVGRAIAGRLAETLTPSTLELSGSDSAIVLADADVELAAKSVAFALRLNVGQTCLVPRRVLVERGLHGRFVEVFREAIRGGGAMTVPQADERERAERAAREAVETEDDAAWVTGEDGTLPYVVDGCPADSDLFRGAHFGPALAIRAVDSLDEALGLHARIPKKLATAVFTRDRGLAESLIPQLGSGVVTINDCVIPTGHPGLGIGGIGNSGWGVSRGAEGLLAMTRPVNVSRTGRRIRTPLDEPNDSIKARIARFAAWLYR